ncbi:MAG: 50S ribosomal protein L30 [Candidatus Gastranaerophilales bacterium]|nr:50S ribosomal protein L30 [Candidatus Gastranaerophilales bacterium]
MTKKSEKIQIKLVKSTIGAPEKHEKIVRALGLSKTNRVVEHAKNATILGMVNKIPHLVEVVEVK